MSDPFCRTCACGRPRRAITVRLLPNGEIALVEDEPLFRVCAYCDAPITLVTSPSPDAAGD